MPSSAALSESVEEYLEAIRKLGKTVEGVSTTRLARHMDVKPASVTGMLRRLSHLGLVTYRRYRDIALTPAGEQRANEVIRRHRLAERLLTDVLGVPLDEVHDEACRLEHAVSPALEGRLARVLGGPQKCPHGHPLDADAEDESLSLLDAPLNRSLMVVRLENETSEVVRYLTERKLLPGARVKVKAREPLDGSVVLEVAGDRQLLGPQIADGVRVRSARR
ncbi:MAG: metal-dependent transcriptional regulator [Armatimonadota bacterium]|nr:MAG: metal-dependent transcriptional regulator [Armatimonadota bacterium]